MKKYQQERFFNSFTRFFFESNQYSTPNESQEIFDNEVDDRNRRYILAAQNIIEVHYGSKGEIFHVYKTYLMLVMILQG